MIEIFGKNFNPGVIFPVKIIKMDFQPPDIPDVIQDHILHEVGLRTPELQAYGNVLRLYGENSITKNDFDYWYYRFLDDNDEMDVEFVSILSLTFN